MDIGCAVCIAASLDRSSCSDKSIDVRSVMGSFGGWYRTTTALASPIAALCRCLPLQMTT